jgi:hypothetical protein
MTNPEGYYITLPSESVPTSIDMSVLFIISIVSEMCAPLGMGRLGTQPFKVSKTFCTPQHFESLLAQGMILLNSRGIQLEPANFCINKHQQTLGHLQHSTAVLHRYCSDP